VIAGPVNAGKSTLFNRLLGERRAIESVLPGTTRDVVRARAQLGRYPVELRGHRRRRRAGRRRSHGRDRAGRPGARAQRARARRPRAVALAAGRPAPPPVLPPGIPIVELLSRADEASTAELALAAAAIAPLADPRAAVARVEAEFHRSFRLPAEPWSPGRGAPFDARSRQALAALAAAPESERPRRAAELSTRGD
jgi:tRNA modification GTPase